LRRLLPGSSSAPGISPPKTRDPADDRALARTYLAAQAAIKRYLDSKTVRDEAKAVLRFVYDGAFDDLSRRVAEKALLSIMATIGEGGHSDLAHIAREVRGGSCYVCIESRRSPLR
jgi:hypothetical protein